MNSVTFKVVRDGSYLRPFGWNGGGTPADQMFKRMFPWPGLYEVSLRTSTQRGVFRVSRVDDGWSRLWVWTRGRWNTYRFLCVPALRRLPIGVPFTADTEWLRIANEQEIARWH